jgi:hypothetical protein
MRATGGFGEFVPNESERLTEAQLRDMPRTRPSRFAPLPRCAQALVQATRRWLSESSVAAAGFPM